MNIEDVINKAISLGACSESGKATDWKSLCWLFFSPQGREFCEDNNYPSIDLFRGMSKNIEPFGIYVDHGHIELQNKSNIGVIGDTEAHLVYNDNTKVHKIVLMHGGKATIEAGNYSVILLVNIRECEVNIINDGTARIL
ncbi:hypothetical protein [Parabacteroides chongii]|uniref:hypothetical protein n=1 Tax=Parabacteroides chongii TaxID=2685834 RepID=UPI00240D4A5D|nr:hypothetical protein [Parabacteroides chongii]WFE85043.1 hypothetical protein P3L47_00075 [Parabacteroides chongii]